MRKKQKISRFEAILIAAIIIMAAFFGVIALEWPAHSIAHRDDALWANTALSDGIINSNNGENCVVDGCEKENCEHMKLSAYIGYFDPSDNTIIAEKPEGYNEETRISLDGNIYRGEINTLVIEVKAENGEVSVSWVEGKE